MTTPRTSLRRFWLLLALSVLLPGVALLLARHHRPPIDTVSAQGGDKPAVASVLPTRFVAVAGGATPDSNPISLEQNLWLAHAVLPGPGVLLFGGGPQTPTVQVLEPNLPEDELRTRLGELFSPRAGRDSRYQATSLPASAATIAAVRAELGVALSKRGAALLVYVSAHGDQGEAPRDNTVQLWGGDVLTPIDLADLHDRSPGKRGLRAVITSCYSGGFAELAFAGADADKGVARKERCGLFATTWDRESSGCDPNPDRAAQEGYSLHFFNALRGVDRDGVTPIDADYDHDGTVTLLEAHARATIAGGSIDVPTTTSERFLRQHVQQVTDDDDTMVELPEQAAVVAQLGERVQLRDEAAARRALTAVQDELDALAERLSDAAAESDTTYNTLAMSLLSRWPVIDDPYHPLYATTIAQHRDAIVHALTKEPPALAHQRSRDALQELDALHERLEVQQARLLRLTRAYETQHLAARLEREHPAAWKQFVNLRRCEHSAP